MSDALEVDSRRRGDMQMSIWADYASCRRLHGSLESRVSTCQHRRCDKSAFQVWQRSKAKSMQSLIALFKFLARVGQCSMEAALRVIFPPRYCIAGLEIAVQMLWQGTHPELACPALDHTCKLWPLPADATVHSVADLQSSRAAIRKFSMGKDRTNTLAVSYLQHDRQASEPSRPGLCV